MALTSGTRLGPYEIVAAIGAGGMGEVYRARDTSLGRQVAIKVLPDAFAQDVERLARFEREAKTLASLNHPHIAQIYGLEKSSGVQALVMELVEGEDLSQRIARGPIPVDEVLPIAKQIAEALEAAHEQGIIHRDLKPANIKVTPDGVVKVLDFGLAKLNDPKVSNDPNAPNALSMSPTITSPAMMTGVGTILGTAAYMAPEQAKGRPADKRGDIWAFGCVLYEMLTGKRAFEGESVAETLARVIEREPNFSALPPRTPSSIVRLLRRSLVKDRQMRLPDIAVARIEIHEAITQPETISDARSERTYRARWTAAIQWVLTGLAITGLLLIMLVGSRRTASPAQSVMRVELTLPVGVELSTTSAQSAALSPDGTVVAFVGSLAGRRQLYVRRLDGFEATPLRGTGPVIQSCFFSPDGRAVAFLSSEGILGRINLADGQVVTLARAVDFLGGGVWGPDDRITFAREGALWQVPASGGSPRQLTSLDTAKHELQHAWPAVVGGGRAILFTAVTGTRRDDAHIEALTLATSERHAVVDSGIFPLYTPSGHLIFFRDGALLAAPFDADRLEVTGSPVRAVQDLAVDTLGAPSAAVSSSGALIYSPSSTAAARLVWVSRQGVEEPIAGVPRPYQTPNLAPDGQRVAVQANGDLWIQDTARATFTRLTSDETVGNTYPVWTPDGTRIVFRTRAGLYWMDADGSGQSQAIPGTSVSDIPSAVSPDGETLVFTRLMTDGGADIYALNLRRDSKPRALVNTKAYEGGAQFSPDGRWIAYAADESGQTEVYLRPFPGPDRKWPVSTQGGTSPLWNSNGRELFYRSGNKMMVVDVSTTPALVLSAPRVLFEQRYTYGRTTTSPNYTVSPDGQHFLMVKDESGLSRLNVVLNWSEELKRLVPTK